eukprot:6370724-Lingulodinium_polyedra.AAC.1
MAVGVLGDPHHGPNRLGFCFAARHLLTDGAVGEEVIGSDRAARAPCDQEGRLDGLWQSAVREAEPPAPCRPRLIQLGQSIREGHDATVKVMGAFNIDLGKAVAR